MKRKTVEAIRSFNRYYTGVLGLLDRHILNSPFSLPEARILYELYHQEGIQASGIIEKLGIDKGYLSRILDQFLVKKLITRKRSDADGRLMHIYLTEKGKKEFELLNKASDEQLKKLLEPVAEAKGDDLMQYMDGIMHILQRTPVHLNDIAIRTELRPGDIGYIIHLHGLLYKKECDFGLGFESYVAKGLAEFVQQYEPARDRVWICEHQGKIVGFLALMHREEDTAQLRYFLLEPAYRGVGLGRRLMELFMSWLKEAGYRHVYLWTTQEQETAIALYKRQGFTLSRKSLPIHLGRLWSSRNMC